MKPALPSLMFLSFALLSQLGITSTEYWGGGLKVTDRVENCHGYKDHCGQPGMLLYLCPSTCVRYLGECNDKCQPGGKCNTDFKCECKIGWEGESCELEVPVTGGKGKERPADEKTQKLLKGLQGVIEERVGKKFDEFTLISYATQVVAGRNIYAKVRIGTDKYIHIRVFHQPWTRTLEVHDVQKNKALDDPV